MSRSLTFTIGLVVSLAACSIPKSDFHATNPDGGAVPGDAQTPTVLSIVVSATAVDVDEGASKNFTVTLSQAPSGTLTVSVATTATTKLGISVPTLAFTPTNFGQPQTITLTGLADLDTVDEHADVTLTADGVDPVTVGTTIHDLDKVNIITDVGATSTIIIDEGGKATVHVHLSAQPTGDVGVTAVLGAGPVTVSPAMRVFTTTNYDADQVFTFSAATDANLVSEDESLTFRAANVPDKLLSIHDVDKDVQNILVSPTSATITEQTTTATLNVSLTQQPSSNVTVSVATTTGQASIDVNQLTFTPQNYATTQSVTVSAPDDPDTADGSDTIHLQATDPDSGGHLDRTVAITIKDNDVQQILDDAPPTFSVTETGMATFNATLKFKPAADVIVSVTTPPGSFATASPGTLTFTPLNYNLPHLVTVTGVHDNNLATDTATIQLSQAAIGMTNVTVSVTDVDHQTIILNPTALSVPEGMNKTFDVSLMFNPGTTVTVALDETPTGLPIDQTTIPFTATNFATPVHVRVSPTIDSNTTSEMTTITASGAGAPTPSTLTVTTVDSTVVTQYGWPMPFTQTLTIGRGTVIAYQIHVDTTSLLDSFGVYVPVAAGDFRMALYDDAGGKPGNLVAQMPLGKTLVNGSNVGDVNPDVMVPVGNYWVALRVAQTTAVGAGTATQTGMQCILTGSIDKLNDNWPSPFGQAGCTSDTLLNLWITNYHQ